MPELTPFGGVISSAIDYLNAGGSLQALTKHLYSSGILVDETRDLMAPDLNGDRLQDFAIVLLDPTASMPFERGVLAVAVCAGDNLQLAIHEAPAAEPSFPSLVYAQDLTGDGRDDLLVSWRECGAHTCYERLQVLAQQALTLVDRIRGDSRDLPNPVIDILWTPGRPAQIRMAGTGFGSVGAGPYRTRVRIWSWDDAEGLYWVTEESVEPSPYRIHALIDADLAALSGDFQQAGIGYDRVISDQTLLAWADPDVEYRSLSAYARYRRVLLSLQLGDEATAHEALMEMTEPGHLSEEESPFLELAQVLWEAYVQTGDLGSACASARALATDPGSDIIRWLDFGYANPSYSADDICPIGAP